MPQPLAPRLGDVLAMKRPRLRGSRRWNLVRTPEPASSTERAIGRGKIRMLGCKAMRVS